ncbi:hypothetical protein HRD49_06865 [Corallococcus exiguus]|uniref:hypothetical protein n=1 Tax=Corallococcus exiguus TaxID=83462 RepID=UPI001560B019|nr:hypothetical protein [Corallococcus exiguus]NRD61470.1 hypothetical protein [Corallococcus exiguus]
MPSNRKATSNEQPRIPDEFTLSFKRAPGGGWNVSGASTGEGRYAYEAFCDAFCRMAKPVSAASLPSTATDSKARSGKKGGGR